MIFGIFPVSEMGQMEGCGGDCLRFASVLNEQMSLRKVKIVGKSGL